MTSLRTTFSGSLTRRAAALAALLAAASLQCSVLVGFSECGADGECRLGERCNAARGYCEVPAAGAVQRPRRRPRRRRRRGRGLRRLRRPDGRALHPGDAPLRGGALRCVERATPAPAETCFNGVDDDCNGLVDDGAGCVLNIARSTAVRIGSNDPAEGEGDDAPEHRVCLASYSIDKHEVSNRAFLAWINSLDPARISVGRPPMRRSTRTRSYGTFVLYNEGTAQAPRQVPLVLLPESNDPGYALSLRRRGTLFETLQRAHR